MTGGTTVRELLDLAIDQLDALSRQTISSAPPEAASLAEAWPGFAAASRQLLAVSLARHNPGDPIQREAFIATRAGPRGPSTGAGEPRLARAADLIGAAADLIEPHARMVMAPDRRAACVDAARVYLLGAQITSHATMQDLRTLDTAAAAAASARDAARVIHAAPEQTSLGRLAHAATRRRPEPGAGDLVSLFDQAVFDWRAAALHAARRPDVSSEDLRGSALCAGRIVALAQVLHRAHWKGRTPEEASRATDLALTRAGHGLSAVASQWTGFATGTPTSPDLVHASSRLQQSIALLACDGPGWVDRQELCRRAPPLPALRSAQAALADVGAVGQQHSDVTRSMVGLGRLYRRWVQSDQPQQVVNVLRSARWVSASGWDTAGLLRSYGHVETALSENAVHTTGEVVPHAVAGARTALSRAKPAAMAVTSMRTGRR